MRTPRCWPLARSRRRRPRASKSRHPRRARRTCGCQVTGAGGIRATCGCPATGRSRFSPATCGRPGIGRRMAAATCGSRGAGARDEGAVRLGRRQFLRGALTLGAVAVSAPLTRRAGAQLRFADPPFQLGVASGYPTPSGVVLWTRLAPMPLAPGGGVSPVGHTRTAPAANAEVDRLRFAFASCQQYEQGYYGAHHRMAADVLDLVVHLGDYIYESSWGRDHVRKHGAPEPYTLDDYRIRHAVYKSDPDLQAAHAACPWIVTWDDHEVANDYANDRSQFAHPREIGRAHV